MRLQHCSLKFNLTIRFNLPQVTRNSFFFYCLIDLLFFNILLFIYYIDRSSLTICCLFLGDIYIYIYIYYNLYLSPLPDDRANIFATSPLKSYCSFFIFNLSINCHDYYLMVKLYR